MPTVFERKTYLTGSRPFSIRWSVTISVLVLKVLAVRVNTVVEGGSEKPPNRM